MAVLTNKEYIDLVVKRFPNKVNSMAQDPYKLLTDTGYGEISMDDPAYLGDFFGLLVRVWLEIVNVSRARNPLADQGFGEFYDTPYGGITQRMSIGSVSPVNPGWVGLENGDSPDQFVVRKAPVEERFFKSNLNYASLITIPDDFQLRQIFVSNYGIGEFFGGMMTALENGYIVQQYAVMLDSINAMINPTGTYTLQDSQQFTVQMSDVPTQDELIGLILAVKNIISMMTIDPQSSAFNAAKFKTVQDRRRLKMLIKAGYKNAINTLVLANAFNQERLNLDIDVIEVANFGGLKPTNAAGATLYPVYDNTKDLGILIGYATTATATTPTVTEDQVVWVDPNADVIAVIADRGAVFYDRQNPYQVEPARNVRGRYTNYWASSPNNGVHVDYFYNWVVIRGEAPAEPDTPPAQ